MEVDIVNQDVTASGISLQGAVFSGPVLLYGNPTNALQAASKQYVDITIAAHAADNSLHPTAAEKSLLTNIAVAPSEINELSGVTSNIQTQLNTKFNLSGGTLSGSLILNADPTDVNHASTKHYVDSTVTAIFTVSVGDIITKPSYVTPTGFLKCSGAYVSQTAYAGLFAQIGHNYETNASVTLSYTSHAALGSGKPWHQQYDISSNSTSLSSVLVTGAVLPVAVSGAQAVITRNRVYLLGGMTGTGVTDTNVIQVAPINADGTLGPFTVDSNVLPGAFGNSQVVVTKNRVYLLGAPGSSAVYTAPINIDGTLGSFTIASVVLPTALQASQVLLTKNRVYLFGGQISSGATNVIYTAPVNVDGTLGAFTTDANVLPAVLYRSQIVVTNNRVYLLGGFNGTTAVNTIYTATINADGTVSAFTNTGSVLPASFFDTAAVVTKNQVYLFGGWNANASVALNTIYMAPINVDGTLGAFTSYGTLPAIDSWIEPIVTKNHVYLLGGFDGNVRNYINMATFTNTSFNDLSQLYNGTINKFDGTDLTGTYLIYTANPDINTYFGLPDSSVIDSLTPNRFHYIKY